MDSQINEFKDRELSESFLPSSLVNLIEEVQARDKDNFHRRGGIHCEPCSSKCPSAVLLADISGYTALSQTLCNIGADGVDALREELNCFFTTLVDAVHEHGGDIYKFAGDAIIVIWPQSRHFKDTPLSTLVNKAILCALQLVQVEHTITALDKLIAQDTNKRSSDSSQHLRQARSTLVERVGSELTLGLHCGIGAGPMELAMIGGAGGSYEFIANGTPYAQIEVALEASVRGEVAVSPEVWKLASGTMQLDGQRVEPPEGASDESASEAQPYIVAGVMGLKKTTRKFKRQSSLRSANGKGLGGLKASQGDGNSLAGLLSKESAIAEDEEEGEDKGTPGATNKPADPSPSAELATANGGVAISAAAGASGGEVNGGPQSPSSPTPQRPPGSKPSKASEGGRGRKLEVAADAAAASNGALDGGSTGPANGDSNSSGGESGAAVSGTADDAGSVAPAPAAAPASGGSPVSVISRQVAVSSPSKANEETREAIFGGLAADLRQLLAPVGPFTAQRASSEHEHWESIKPLLRPQIRDCSVLFVNITPIINGKKVKCHELELMELQPVFESMQKILLRFEAMLRQFLVDDKGLVLIAVLGTPKHAHHDDVDRSLRMALELDKCLKGYDYGASIGVATGPAYCGRVGNDARQEYAVIGSIVNLAAKIMAKNKGGGVRCDGASRERANSAFFSFKDCEPIAVKGFAHPVQISVPNQKKWAIAKRAFAPTTHNLGNKLAKSRQRDLLQVERIVSATAGMSLYSIQRLSALKEVPMPVMKSKGCNWMVMVDGSRGSGKSLFVKKINSVAKDYGMQVFSTAAQENTRAAPFATIRTMLSYLLELDNVAGTVIKMSPAAAKANRNASFKGGGPLGGGNGAFGGLIARQVSVGGTVHGETKAFPKSHPASANRDTIVARLKETGRAADGGANASVSKEMVSLEAEIEAKLDRQINNIMLPVGITAEKIKSVLLNLVARKGRKGSSFMGLDSNVQLDGGLIECLSALITLSLANAQARFPKNLMIIMDDLQWVDDASWTLLKHMAHATYGVKIVFVVTTRETTLVDKESRDDGRVFDLNLSLEPLTEEDVGEIIKDEFGRDPIPHGVTCQIHASSGGNPFWVVELAKAMHRKPGIGASIRGDEGKELSHHALSQCIVERFDMLNHTQQVVLMVACVIGQAFSYSMLLKLLPVDILTTVVKEGTLGDEKMGEFITPPIELEQEDEYSFNHDFIRQTVYDMVPRAERVRSHERVAMCLMLEYCDHQAPWYNLIADHYDKAGKREQFLEYLTMTIEQTIRLGGGQGGQSSLEKLLKRATDALRSQYEAVRLLAILEVEQKELQKQSIEKGSATALDRQNTEKRLNAAHVKGGGQNKARGRRLATVQFDELSNMTTIKMHQLDHWIKTIKDTNSKNLTFRKEEEKRDALLTDGVVSAAAEKGSDEKTRTKSQRKLKGVALSVKNSVELARNAAVKQDAEDSRSCAIM